MAAHQNKTTIKTTDPNISIMLDKEILPPTTTSNMLCMAAPPNLPALPATISTAACPSLLFLNQVEYMPSALLSRTMNISPLLKKLP